MADVQLQTLPTEASPADAHVIAGDNGANTVKFLLSAIKAFILTSPVLSGGTATADPSVALGLATKQYVDGIAANLGKRQRVRAATVANITIATALNNGDTLDGVTLATGDLVLVKDQTAPAENGVYVVGVSPARAAEFDAYDEYPGSLIAVQEGTVHADDLFLCTSNVGGTIGVTGIVFAAFSAPTDAASVSVADAGGYFAGVNVETVLQEVGASLAGKVDALAAVTITASTNLTRASHANRLLICNSGTAINLTIEDDTTGGWGASDYFPVLNIGAGTVTIQGDGTSAVTPVPGFALTIPQDGIGAAQRSGTNAWSAYGQSAVQAQATWEAGVGTTESVISPAKLAAAIAALAPAGSGPEYGIGTEFKFLIRHAATVFDVVPANINATLQGTVAAVSASFNTSYGLPRGTMTATDAVVNSGQATMRGGVSTVLYAPGATDSQRVVWEGYFFPADSASGRRWAVGAAGVTANPTASADPDAILNSIMFGKNAANANVHLIRNDGSGAGVSTDLGADFPAAQSGDDAYYGRLVFTGGATRTLDYYIRHLGTGLEASGQVTDSLPAANNALLCPLAWVNNGPTTATAATMDFSSMRLAAYYAGVSS
jgi:hypothetical protein